MSKLLYEIRLLACFYLLRAIEKLAPRNDDAEGDIIFDYTTRILMEMAAEAWDRKIGFDKEEFYNEHS